MLAHNKRALGGTRGSVAPEAKCLTTRAVNLRPTPYLSPEVSLGAREPV